MDSQPNPYQPPASADAANVEFRVFATEFFRQWLVISTGVSLGSSVLVLPANWLLQNSSPLMATLGACLFCLVLAVLFGAGAAGFLVMWFKVYVCEQGIRCFDFWGIYSFHSWNSVRRVKRTNVLGLPYLRLFCDQSRRPLWLPLFLVDKADFWNCVGEWTEKDSPLAIAAAEHLTK